MAIWFKERPKSDQVGQAFKHGEAKKEIEPIFTDAALWSSVWFVRNHIMDNQSLAENDDLHASANTLL